MEIFSTMDNDKATKTNSSSDSNDLKEENNTSNIANSTPTPTATPKKRPALNFGDCGHPPNTIQQFGFAGGH